MAEAIAGLSIAANVLGVLDFSLKTISVCKQICDEKSPAPEATTNAQALDKAVKQLQQSLPSGAAQTSEHQELRTLAKDLLTLSSQVQQQLEKCQVQRGSSKLLGFAKAFEYQLVRKRKVEELESSLSKLQHTMETRILVALRQQIEANHVAIHSKLDDLDQGLQSFISKVQSGEMNLTALVKHEGSTVQKQVIEQSLAIQRGVALESTLVRAHVSSEAQTTRQEIHDSHALNAMEARHERLLASSYFDEMNTRQNQLAEAHERTFGWILKRGKMLWAQSNANSGTERNQFVGWLEDDRPIFWISGKPGSGKSTLMRFIINDERTQKILDQSSPGAIILSAFIWLAGSPMQRSVKGILCTLLHGLISHMPSVLQKIGNDHVSWTMKSHGDWSVRNLEHTFRQLVEAVPQRVYLFVDGLDEIDPSFSEGQENLWKLLQRLSTLNHIKLCVSSRPEPILERRLGSYPYLKLQDLTQRDVEQFAFSRLDNEDMHAWIRNQAALAQPTVSEKLRRVPSLDNLVARIIGRAEGVFLWVCLVTHAIHCGIINDDNWNALLKQIDSLSPELSKLYENLWNRQTYTSSEHRQQTAEYLNTVLDNGNHKISIMSMLFSRNIDLCQLILRGGEFVPMEAIIQRCRILRRQVISKCCGLLEFHLPRRVDLMVNDNLFKY